VHFALSFGPPEYFAFAVLALATTSMLGGRPLKATFSALLGLAIGTVGIDTLSGTNRFTYGVLAIYNGIDFELVTIGLYAVVEVLFVVGTMRLAARQRAATVGKLYMTKEEWRRSAPAWLRGTGLGFFTGVLPGAGATVASYLSYGLERSISKTPERFGRGKGMIEGLAAPEAANNAASQGALVPLLTLGIPPTAATAVMLGALQGFGVKTGPLLLRDNPDFVWAIVASLLIGNILLLILNVPLIGVWVRLLKVPTALLAPMILVISTVGVFSLSRNTADLVLMLIFGAVGLLLRICDIPLAPAVLGLVLGPLMEAQWGRGLTVGRGDWTIFFSTPLAIVILILAVIALFLPLILKGFRGLGARRRERRAAR